MNILEAIEEMKKGKICQYDIWIYRINPICEFEEDGGLKIVRFSFSKDIEDGDWKNPIEDCSLCIEPLTSQNWKVIN